MQFIKQSEATAARRTVLIGPLANTADDSAYTSTLSGADLRISKAGAAEANSAGTATHIANGLFSYAFTTGEVDTLGALSIRVAKSGVYGDVFVRQVVAFDPYDSAGMGLSRIDVATSTRLAATDYSAPETILSYASGIDTGLTLKSAMQAVFAMSAGRRAGVNTGTETFRNYGNTGNTVAMTFDSAGNTTAITYTFT